MSDAKRAEKLILMVIEGNVYECSAYVPQHPGEGIRGINLSQFRFKNTTREFDQVTLSLCFRFYCAKIALSIGVCVCVCVCVVVCVLLFSVSQ